MSESQHQVNQATTKARVGVRRLRSELAGYLARAAAGETIIITVGGKATARLAPLDHDGRRTLEVLARSGAAQAPTVSPRRALGHNRPPHDRDRQPPWADQVTGLDGSRLLARVRG